MNQLENEQMAYRYFIQEDIQVTNSYVERFSTSLDMRKKQMALILLLYWNVTGTRARWQLSQIL